MTNWLTKFMIVLDILISNWYDMHEDNVIGNDRYFHCKANCQASKYSKGISYALSYLRELAQGDWNNNEPIVQYDCQTDMEANEFGIFNSKKNESCSKTCNKYRVKGINYKF